MPIYEYQCQNCGFEHEALQKISDDPLLDCPSCGAPALQKMISAAGFRLSGSGWYETDFKSSNQKNLSQKDSGKPVKSDSKKADSKSPAKKSSNANA